MIPVYYLGICGSGAYSTTQKRAMVIRRRDTAAAAAADAVSDAETDAETQMNIDFEAGRSSTNTYWKWFGSTVHANRSHERRREGSIVLCSGRHEVRG